MGEKHSRQYITIQKKCLPMVKSPVRFREKHNNRWLETFWSLDYFSFICTFTFPNAFVYCAFPCYITDLLEAPYRGPAPFDTFYTPMKFIYDEYIATLLPIGRHKCSVLACHCTTAAVSVLICTARISANSCSVLGAGTVQLTPLEQRFFVCSCVVVSCMSAMEKCGRFRRQRPPSSVQTRLNL